MAPALEVAVAALLLPAEAEVERLPSVAWLLVAAPTETCA